MSPAGESFHNVAPDKPGFLEELKRRHVWRIALGYAVAAWLLVQVATQVFPFFNIPNWSVRLVVVVLAIGFPIAVVLAWVYEITPEGVRRTEPADSPDARPEYASRQIGRKLNTVIMAVLVIAVALLGWRLLVLRHAGSARPKAIAAAHAGSPDGAQRKPGMASNITPDSTAGAVPSGLRGSSGPAKPGAFNPPVGTLVVLPFANLDDNPKQQYFSDGITEELTNALGQNTALQVIAWDTASKYRDRKQSATEIAKALNVANVLTGKILRQGSEVRVIVELVNARTGYQTWSSHYDDSLSNIFQVQDKITASISDALKVKFASARATTIVNPEAHDLVLKGLARMNGRVAGGYEQARKHFEQAIAIDPGYAAAHAVLARTLIDLTQYSTLSLQEALPEARAEAQKALALDPDNVDAIVALANADLIDGNNASARAGYERAIALDPSNAIARLNYGVLLPPAQALAQNLKAVQLDPQQAVAQNNLASTYLDLGEYRKALPVSEALARMSPSPDTAFGLAQNYALVHRDADAVKAFDLARPTTEQATQLVAVGKLAYQSVLDPKLRPQARAALETLRERTELDPTSLADLLQVYLILDEKNAALALLSKLIALTPQSYSDLAVNPLFIPLRGDPAFHALVEKYDTSSHRTASATSP
jgi:TolB-like protein/Tfp pilus assembly protein PilF